MKKEYSLLIKSLKNVIIDLKFILIMFVILCVFCSLITYGLIDNTQWFFSQILPLTLFSMLLFLSIKLKK